VDAQIVPGDVLVDEGMISSVGASPAGRSGMAVPGFVDLQVNGFAGTDFLACDAQGYADVAGPLLATGVTAYQPTLISAPLEGYEPALTAAAEASERAGTPRILGVHLEGPFLSPSFAGAHDAACFLEPDIALADRLCDAGPVTYVTLAPEQPGALDLITHLVRRGITVAVGHCDADAATAHAAFDRGARAVTHLHNAQRRWQARDPGVSGVALARSDVVVQAIVDGIHLAPETVLTAFRAARGRFALVTDAVQAAGLDEGSYRLGDRTIRVADGAVRLDDGTLAGSVLTIDQAVRNLVDLGVSLIEALESATRVPAGLAGRPDLGTLRPGTTADVAVLNDALDVQRTLVAGEERFAR
jgi:N-acetylglucosamine-6-phosphate deacetylase